jgi:hypothetical protein
VTRDRADAWLSLEDDEFALIGKITAHGAYLEYALHRAIWCMLDIHFSDTRLATGRINAKVLLQICTDLFAERFTRTDDRLRIAKWLCRAADACFENRNNIVHGVWIETTYDFDTGEAVYMDRIIQRERLRKETKKFPSFMEFDEESLEKIASDLYKVALAIDAFIETNAHELRRSSPDK